jgi:hypothetical protein
VSTLLACLVSLGLQVAQPTAGREPPVPPMRIGRDLLARCPLVVVARTITAREATVSSDLLHVRVVERMLGRAVKPGDELTVLSPVGQFQFGDEDLLFLRPYRDGNRYEVVERVSSTDPNYEAKLSISRRSIWLMEIPEPEQRADATLSLLLRLLGSRDRWTRSHAIDELAWMAREHHALFTPARRARLISAGRVSPHQAVREGVESVAKLLSSLDKRLRETTNQEQSPP